MLNSELNTMSGKTTIKGNPSQYVKLNVGGCLHYTTIGTLTKQDTMLRAMFSGRMEVLSDSDGKHFSIKRKQLILKSTKATSNDLSCLEALYR